MSYRDTTFCASKVTEHTCGREITEQDAINAEKWWGGKDYPVAYSKFCKEADTNQPDHNEEVLEMVTDTNQASEDIVDSILSTLGIVDRKSGNRPDQIQVVKQIIRTEKLKLLAEVRERVVGDFEKLDMGGSKEAVSRHNIAYDRNWLRIEQMSALNKLEAEL